ncbi:tRNA lysidine(34) synthetase TilS [Cutibacterium sp. WCA-380-WT-3A]|uniref:tRNA(Ile)-lysidine synthase n=1 Tax=Cutibacterium porci TaxID=2605781 RepID=A0A7K0J4U0_9ACTN|nr:tRNA lysidine(34) synthetase TilS [Cutibacterium porci]MSS44956.1 tRNA lysidine(34) synthetase TilS [Cutibacterium porci]
MARHELGPAGLAVSQAIERMVRGVDRFVVGCSGGPDSLALALGSRWVSRRCGSRVRVVIVDHQLQQGSDEVAERTRQLVARRGMEACVRRVDVDANDPDGPEAAARTARRAALLDVARGEPVLLGHTLDDQAEQVLLSLARGSGATSLAGIRPRSGQFWHPLLEVRRAQTMQACKEWQVEPWQDPHNSDPRFLRSRVRTELMPVMAQVLGPGVAQSLARSATLLAGEDDVVAGLARAWADEHAVSANELPGLRGVEVGLARRVIKDWLPEAKMVHVDAVLGLLTGPGGAGVDVPGGRVEVRRGVLYLTRRV